MKNRVSLQRLLLNALLVAAGPGLLLLVAYLLPSAAYNHFNQIYYSASLLSMIGTMGLDVSTYKHPLPHSVLFLCVLANVLLLTGLMRLFGFHFGSTQDIFNTIIFGYLTAVGNIITTKMLFSNQFKIYCIISAMRGAFQVLAIPMFVFLRVDLLTSMILLNGVWLVLCVIIYPSHEKFSFRKVIETYKEGVCNFFINSAAGIGFNIDKYVVNHFFPIAFANIYTFSWSLVAPVFYLGNAVEKTMYSSDEVGSLSSILIKYSFALMLLLLVYVACVWGVVIFFPTALPRSAPLASAHLILSLMLLIYGVYTMFHYPLNGLLFKHINLQARSKIAIYHFWVMVLVCLLVLCLRLFSVKISYISVLGVVWIYLSGLLISKAFLLLSEKRA